jgi:hypothetical protein
MLPDAPTRSDLAGGMPGPTALPTAREASPPTLAPDSDFALFTAIHERVVAQSLSSVLAAAAATAGSTSSITLQKVAGPSNP